MRRRRNPARARRQRWKFKKPNGNSSVFQKIVARGEESQTVIPKEKFLQSDGGDDIMEVLWALFDTALRLDALEKREQILESARFMADYLGLEEWITEPRLSRKRPA